MFEQDPPWRTGLFIASAGIAHAACGNRDALSRDSVRWAEVLSVVRRRQVEHELDGAVVGLEREHAADHEKRLPGVFEFDEVARLRDVRALVVGKAGAGLFADGFCGVFGEFDREVGSHVSPVGSIEENGWGDFRIAASRIRADSCAIRLTDRAMHMCIRPASGCSVPTRT